MKQIHWTVSMNVKAGEKFYQKDFHLTYVILQTATQILKHATKTHDITIIFPIEQNA